MKLKTLAMAMIIIAATTQAKAQNLHFGIKAGADINKIDGQSFSKQFSYGYQVGVFSEIGLTSQFGIQPEILLSQVKVDTADNFSNVYHVHGLTAKSLQYLKIPLLLSYKPNAFVSLQLGPQYGILLDKNKSAVENGKSAFKQGDFSMVGGLQLNISKIRLYGRYAVGLSNLNDIDNTDKWKSQSFQVGVGVTL